MKTVKNLTFAIGIFFAAASAQAATINCTPAIQRAHFATLERQVQALTTQVQMLQNQPAISAQPSADTQPDSHLPLGEQFDIATGG
jgi:hypothetical protein